jgi:hypothetical protein
MKDKVSAEAPPKRFGPIEVPASVIAKGVKIEVGGVLQMVPLTAGQMLIVHALAMHEGQRLTLEEVRHIVARSPNTSTASIKVQMHKIKCRLNSVLPGSANYIHTHGLGARSKKFRGYSFEQVPQEKKSSLRVGQVSSPLEKVATV